MTIDKSGAILLRNTMAFDRNRAEDFKQAIRDAVLFAKANAPQLMVHVFIDDSQALCYSFQLYQDSESILRHWEVSDPHIARVMQYCVVQSMEVYGTPSQAVREGILAGVDQAKVSFLPELIGYHHLVPGKRRA